jgi:hypothetical protein
MPTLSDVAHGGALITTTLTLTKPANVTAGDGIIFVVDLPWTTADDGVTYNLPGGFTEIGRTAFGPSTAGSTNHGTQLILWRIAGASEPASWQITLTGQPGSGNALYWAGRVSGAPGTPTASQTPINGVGTTRVAPSIASTSGDLVIRSMDLRNGTTGTTVAWSGTGLTAVHPNDAITAAVRHDVQSETASGTTTGTRTATLNTGALISATATIVIPPSVIAPVNTVVPALTTDGTPQTGETISTDTGTWSNSPSSYTYRWQRDGVDIAGATASTYTLVSADEGHTIRSVVTATNAGGSASANSAGFTALPQPPANTVAPALTGSPFVGEVLTCSTGTWANNPTGYAFQWQRDGADIVGATSATYTLAGADDGHAVRCVVTATNASGSASANSNAVTVDNAPTLNDLVRFRLSGGDGNTSGQTSTGGAPGTVLSAAHGALFADVTGTQARTGLVDYRLIYIENGHDTTTADALRVYLADVPDSAGIELALGLATEGIGEDVAAIPNDRTPPPGVTFSVPLTAEAGLLAGDLAPGDYRGVWVRRTIAPSTPPVADDVSAFGWSATPA